MLVKMLVTFALRSMEAMLNERFRGRTVRVQPSAQLDQMMARFDSLRTRWIECKKLDRAGFAELDNLFRRTEAVMDDAELLASDISDALRVAPTLTLERARMAQLFVKTKRAIRAGQKITHLEEFRIHKLPKKPSATTPPPDDWTQDFNSKKRHNKKVNALEERRKRPLQCCMFVAVAFSQLLGENDMLAEYESEIVGDCFDRAVLVDDGKTYIWSHIGDHSIARLLPPPERYPRLWIHEGDEDTVVPCIVRNPHSVGAPVVTNQICPGAIHEKDYINMNRNNIPTDFSQGPQQPRDLKRKRQ